MMLDFPTRLAGSQMVGRLWTLCKKASERTKGKIDIYNEDAIAYARAFKDALDVQKHGGKIFLPQHLHHNLSLSQQLVLTSR
mmetsp:Transcript_20130/g.43163  ORF Transcript_20130/g.43163 Transcript_20130/m.43163 type:complete len:82 (-) Transcript_20130:68-313(-)